MKGTVLVYTRFFLATNIFSAMAAIKSNRASSYENAFSRGFKVVALTASLTYKPTTKDILAAPSDQTPHSNRVSINQPSSQAECIAMEQSIIDSFARSLGAKMAACRDSALAKAEDKAVEAKDEAKEKLRFVHTSPYYHLEDKDLKRCFTDEWLRKILEQTKTACFVHAQVPDAVSTTVRTRIEKLFNSVKQEHLPELLALTPVQFDDKMSSSPTRKHIVMIGSQKYSLRLAFGWYDKRNWDHRCQNPKDPDVLKLQIRTFDKDGKFSSIVYDEGSQERPHKKTESTAQTKSAGEKTKPSQKDEDDWVPLMLIYKKAGSAPLTKGDDAQRCVECQKMMTKLGETTVVFAPPPFRPDFTRGCLLPNVFDVEKVDFRPDPESDVDVVTLGDAFIASFIEALTSIRPVRDAANGNKDWFEVALVTMTSQYDGVPGEFQAYKGSDKQPKREESEERYTERFPPQHIVRIPQDKLNSLKAIGLPLLHDWTLSTLKKTANTLTDGMKMVFGDDFLPSGWAIVDYPKTSTEEAWKEVLDKVPYEPDVIIAAREPDPQAVKCRGKMMKSLHKDDKACYQWRATVTDNPNPENRVPISLIFMEEFKISQPDKDRYMQFTDAWDAWAGHTKPENAWKHKGYRGLNDVYDHIWKKGRLFFFEKNPTCTGLESRCSETSTS